MTTLPLSAKAYSPGTMENKSTHPLLAEKSIALYEEVSGRTLTPSQREAVLLGTIQEDSPQASSIRSYNHFTTWDSSEGLWGFLSSKQWSTDVNAQTGLVPLDNLLHAGTIRGRALKLFYTDALEPFEGKYPEGDRTWQMALAGDMQSVGHVMHLLQDATVPAHVRNDPHGGLAAAISSLVSANFSDAWQRYVDTTDFHDDGYETWARNNPRILEQIRATQYQNFNRLDAIFETAVTFTGSNFFSDNSFPGMQHSYDSPALQDRRDIYYYTTIEGEEIPLARESFLSNPVFTLANPKPAYFLDAKVLEAQGKILLTKAVEAGAALLDLYFRSVTEEEEPGCVPHTRTYCDRGDLYFEDGCGARELVEQCTSYQECEDAACVDQTTCSNRCSYESEAECIDTDSWRECGYFESSCLSWSESYQCGADESCSSGECVESPACDSHASKICGEGDDVYWRDSCGNLEEIAERCATGEVCENARCVEDVVGCQNECTNNSSACAGVSSLKTCGNYDGDSCTEWGPVNSCDTGEVCNIITSTEAECAGGSTSCNPVEDCTDSGCVFYDSFSGSSIDSSCKWNVYGNVTASGGRARFDGTNGMASLFSSHFAASGEAFGDYSCNGTPVVEVKGRLPGGFIAFTSDEATAFFGTEDNPNTITFSCGYLRETNVAISDEHTLRMEAQNQEAKFYVDGNLTATIPCSERFQGVQIYSAHDTSNSIDYVKVICR